MFVFCVRLQNESDLTYWLFLLVNVAHIKLGLQAVFSFSYEFEDRFPNLH